MTGSVKPLRLVTLPALIAIALLAAPAGASTDGSADRQIQSRAALGREVVSEVNAVRARHGLSQLVVSSALASAARRHSVDMARTGYFDHQSPTRGPFDERVRRDYRAAGYRSWRAGENLLWASPDIDARRAVELWLESPSHRKILLSPGWREIGLSAVHTASAPLVFEGLEVTIITADFGARVR
jgi:uncharacterized protein YkwD